MPFCCNNCGNRCRDFSRRNGPPVRYIVGPVGPMGPAGPQGPRGFTGETGPQGAAGLSDALTAQAVSTTVAADGVVPLTLYSSTPNTVMSVSSSAVNLPNGTYQISYGLSFTGADGLTTAEVSLYANGTAVNNSGVPVYAAAGTKNSASKSVVLSFSAQTPLTLVNTGTNSATYDYAYITALKLA